MSYFQQMLEDPHDIKLVVRRFRSSMTASMICLLGAIAWMAVSILVLAERDNAAFFTPLGLGLAGALVFRLDALEMKQAYHRLRSAGAVLWDDVIERV